MPGVASEVRAQLCALQATAPQKYGYLRRHWRAAKRGLDNTDRTFARAADIHANIDDPDVDTRTLGYTMQILAELDMLEAEPDRNAATLYDLRSYDPGALAAIGRAIDDGQAPTDGVHLAAGRCVSPATRWPATPPTAPCSLRCARSHDPAPGLRIVWIG